MKIGDGIWYRKDGKGKRIRANVVRMLSGVGAIEVKRWKYKARWIPMAWVVSDDERKK